MTDRFFRIISIIITVTAVSYYEVFFLKYVQ